MTASPWRHKDLSSRPTLLPVAMQPHPTEEGSQKTHNLFFLLQPFSGHPLLTSGLPGGETLGPAPSVPALHTAKQPPRVTLEESAVSLSCLAHSAPCRWHPAGTDTAGSRWRSGFRDHCASSPPILPCALNSGLRDECQQPWYNCLYRPAIHPAWPAPTPAFLCSLTPSSDPRPLSLGR